MKYVTNMLAPSMVSQLTTRNGLVRLKKEEDIALLKSLVDFRVCIRNESMVFTLTESLGLNLEERSIQKVSLVSGDYLILVNPNAKIQAMKDSTQMLDVKDIDLEIYYVERECVSEERLEEIMTGLLK